MPQLSASGSLRLLPTTSTRNHELASGARSPRLPQEAPAALTRGALCCGRFPAALSTQGRARKPWGPLSLAQRFPSRSERPASHTADVIPGHTAGTRQGGSGPHLRPETFTAHPKCSSDLLPGDSGQCTQRLPRLSGSHKQDQINSRAYFLLTPHVLGKGMLSQDRFYK